MKSLVASSLRSQLQRIEHGRLIVTLPNGTMESFGGPLEEPGDLLVSLEIKNVNAVNQVLGGGDVAFAEAYFRGEWDSPDLPALLTLLARNQAVLRDAMHGHWFSRLLFRFRQTLRSNRKKQDSLNVAAHYDIGNDFFGLWLDRSMTYSSALFTNEKSLTLEEAQLAKYGRALDEIHAEKGMHILDLGCGWGGFAEYAVRSRGCKVTGIGLGATEIRFAQERIAKQGLQDSVKFLQQDYRQVKGRFDAVVSIESLEAVGERHWNTFFKTIARVLKPGGRVCIQSITLDSNRFAQYRRSTDFVQHYIFPAGMLPTHGHIERCARSAGLSRVRFFRFGEDYAETLRRWLISFDSRSSQMRVQGRSDEFIRLWRFFLAYGIAAFESKATNVAQFTFSLGAGSSVQTEIMTPHTRMRTPIQSTGYFGPSSKF